MLALESLAKAASTSSGGSLEKGSVSSLYCSLTSVVVHGCDAGCKSRDMAVENKADLLALNRLVIVVRLRPRALLCGSGEIRTESAPVV